MQPVQQSALCYGGNGSITVGAINGLAPYTMSLVYSNGDTLDVVAGGTYDVPAGLIYVDLVDANGCYATGNVTVTQPGMLGRKCRERRSEY